MMQTSHLDAHVGTCCLTCRVALLTRVRKDAVRISVLLYLCFQKIGGNRVKSDAVPTGRLRVVGQ